MSEDDAYLALAREIRAEVARIAADPGTHIDLLAELFERTNRDERARLAQGIFDALDAEQQWRVIGELFGDDELRDYLAVERETRRVRAEARAAMALDTARIPAGRVLVLGLFRENDVRAAVARGHRSQAAARRLALRATGDGVFTVLDDVFNPTNGYFVTADYSEETWARNERFESHASIRVGSVGPGGFVAVLYPGGRVDTAIDDRTVPGHLHLGFAMLDEIDIFAP